MDYKDSGVDVEKGDLFVNNIKNFIKKTYDERVVSGVGGFAALYDMGDGRYLASGTDGVGTKLKLAQDLNTHHTIGQDLVAMCVNDIICTGARPLFFLDYLATGKLELSIHEQIVKGIAEACKTSRCVLIGGETAEMPGFYEGHKYDLAGFCVGEVYQEELITGKEIKEGDSIIGISSSGFHSNGFSLVRKLIGENKELMKEALTPTKLYTGLIEKIKNSNKKLVKGVAHITGGGFLNIARINSSFDYHIEAPPSRAELPQHMQDILKLSNLRDEDLYKTFNMGVGLTLITDKKQELTELLEGEVYWDLGVVQGGSGNVFLNRKPL